MASFDDLDSRQLEALRLVRQRRREIARDSSEEHRALLGIVNAAATRRSEKRHRFMLLAGAIVGVSAPLLLQHPHLAQLDCVRVGSALLLATIVVGAVFDAIDEKRTAPILLKVSTGVAAAGALVLAEDIRLVSAGIREFEPALDAQEASARKAAAEADSELRAVGQRFADTAIAETVLFFGTFVVGVLLLLYAVTATSSHAG